MACFADINVSQGSVATCARCGGIFNIHLTANLPRNLSINFLLVKIRQNCGHGPVAPLFWPTLYLQKTDVTGKKGLLVVPVHKHIVIVT